MPPSKQKVFMATVSAPTNIACIKYWGKADAHYNTPINSSVSVTLDQNDLRAVTTAAVSDSFTTDRLWLNGVEQPDAATHRRFRACVDGVKRLASNKLAADGSVLLTREHMQAMNVHVSSYNTFPTAAGLASSAAGYAALVAALAALFHAQETYSGQLSTIARQGSGSACRSLYGGFVAWRMGSAEQDLWKYSMAQQVASERHWPELRALILVVSDLQKDTSSTTGMSTSVATSELLRHRATHIVPKRMANIEQAFLAKDFSTFGQLTMADSNQFHATCLDTYPPIFYMNDVSRSIIQLVHAYNAYYGHIRAAYTFDAGPNAVLYTLDEYAIELGALMHYYYPPATTDDYVNNADYATQISSYSLDPGLLETAQKTGRVPTVGHVKKFYYTKSGPGPQVLTDEEANLDPETGLNCYFPTTK